jgi:hypothetical protein
MKNMYKMKLSHLLSLSLVIFTSIGGLAEARDKNVHKGSHSDDNSIEYSQSAESSYNMSSETHYGLGFSTIQNSLPGGAAALTGIVEFERVNAVQAFFSIPTTTPFNIAGVVLYKRTIVTSKGAGFHLGGGFGLASVNQGYGASFLMNLTAVAGFHFEMPGIPHVLVHLDGGPSLNLFNSSPTTGTSFQVGALSPALGASVLYVF